MKIAILTDALARGARIQGVIAEIPSTSAWVVWCPVGNRGTPARVAREVLNWARIPQRFRNILRLIRLVLRRRLIILRKPLDNESSRKRLLNLNLDVGIHNAGVIYRRHTIDSFRLGILNAHIGSLPEFRGRTVMEWSILKGAPPAVTVFFIDEGIDTGARIVLREDFALSGLRTIAAAKKYLLKQDATLYRRAIEMLAQPGFAFTPNNGGHRYYPMSNLFLGVVERLLAQTEMKPRNVTE